MAHPVLDEIVRAKWPLRPEAFRRWQQAIRHDVIPALESAQAEAPPKSKREVAA